MKQTMKNKTLIQALCVLLLAAGGCSNTKEQLGLTKKSPDEFAVVKRAPLSMPPDYGLRPPAPGAPRPQEQSTAETAKESVFGESTSPAATRTDAEGALLKQTGALNTDPNIRQKLDHEAELTKDYNKPVAQKLLGIGGDRDEPSATIVNAKEESERLKKNAEQGKPVTEGETPSIER